MSSSHEPADWTELINIPSVSLYFGSLICFLALISTRQAYKLSPSFRSKLQSTSFFSTSPSAPASEKAGVMLTVFRDA